eukprot:GILK01005126.1.p1 GENE.GILK01005126.1~~GILK01005126.1.p1  ORF type:complete len:781 (+),score=76.42 GILK01005126.1:98-2440(+)
MATKAARAATRTTSEKPRFKLTTACVPCHKAKASCDSQRPCHRCVYRGWPQECVDHVGKKRGRKAAAESKTVTGSQSSRPLTVQPVRSLDDRGEMMPKFQTAVFRMVFNAVQTVLHRSMEHPNPFDFTHMLGTWRLAMTREQVVVLVDYICSYGDAAFQRLLQAAKTIRPVVRVPFTQLNHQLDLPVFQQNKSFLLSPSQLDLMPFPILYNLFDAFNDSVYFYANDEFLKFTELTRQEVDKECCIHIYRLFSRIIHPDVLLNTLVEIGYNYLIRVPKSYTPSKVITGSGKLIPVTVNTSVQSLSDGVGKIVVFSFCPTGAVTVTNVTPTPLPAPGLTIHELSEAEALAHPLSSAAGADRTQETVSSKDSMATNPDPASLSSGVDSRCNSPFPKRPRNFSDENFELLTTVDQSETGFKQEQTLHMSHGDGRMCETCVPGPPNASSCATPCAAAMSAQMHELRIDSNQSLSQRGPDYFISDDRRQNVPSMMYTTSPAEPVAAASLLSTSPGSAFRFLGDTIPSPSGSYGEGKSFSFSAGGPNQASWSLENNIRDSLALSSSDLQYVFGWPSPSQTLSLLSNVPACAPLPPAATSQSFATENRSSSHVADSLVKEQVPPPPSMPHSSEPGSHSSALLVDAGFGPTNHQEFAAHVNVSAPQTLAHATEPHLLSSSTSGMSSRPMDSGYGVTSQPNNSNSGAPSRGIPAASGPSALNYSSNYAQQTQPPVQFSFPMPEVSMHKLLSTSEFGAALLQGIYPDSQSPGQLGEPTIFTATQTDFPPKT